MTTKKKKKPAAELGVPKKVKKMFPMENGPIGSKNGPKAKQMPKMTEEMMDKGDGMKAMRGGGAPRGRRKKKAK